MGRRKIEIPKNELRKLYWEEKKPPREIARVYNCNLATIRNRLTEYEIPFRTPSQARTRYPRYDFSREDIEKAYLVGFCLADLNVYRPAPTSETIVVRSHTTIPEQTKLFVDLFKRYGHVNISYAKNGKNVHANCYLNDSFAFLEQEYKSSLRRWIRSMDDRMAAFSAGYIDGEGNFQINQGRGRFKMDSYDTIILRDIAMFLRRKGIHAHLRLIGRKGSTHAQGAWKKNLWRITVNTAADLEQFIGIISPYLRHRNRIRDAKIVLKNISTRRRRKTID